MATPVESMSTRTVATITPQARVPRFAVTLAPTFVTALSSAVETVGCISDLIF
jgi:hypothetical protein